MSWRAVIVVLVALSGLSSLAVASPEARQVHYEVELTDPLQPDLPARSFTVTLSFDERGVPQEYRLSLTTGVCQDNICQPLRVILFWDELGNFSRLEHPPHAPLTKYDHEPFTEEDYARLDGILRDKTSILGSFPLRYFVAPPADGVAGVDAMTYATPQALLDAVVPGAASSAWTLWRWVNGEITDHLVAFTKAFMDRDYLLYGLQSDDPRRVEFALRHLSEPGVDGSLFEEALFGVLEKSGRANCQLALDLLTENVADLDRLHHELIKRLGINAGSSRLILGYFEKQEQLPPHVWEQMAGQVRRMNDYVDLDTALQLLKQRGRDLDPVRREVRRLAQDNDPFIARRAKEFLGEQP